MKHTEKLPTLWLKNSNECFGTDKSSRLCLSYSVRTVDVGFLTSTSAHTHAQIFTQCKIYTQAGEDRERKREGREGRREERSYIFNRVFLFLRAK